MPLAAVYVFGCVVTKQSESIKFEMLSSVIMTRTEVGHTFQRQTARADERSYLLSVFRHQLLIGSQVKVIY